jgi:hypothetical protein
MYSGSWGRVLQLCQSAARNLFVELTGEAIGARLTPIQKAKNAIMRSFTEHALFTLYSLERERVCVCVWVGGCVGGWVLEACVCVCCR